MDRVSADQLHGIHMHPTPIVDDLLTLISTLYGLDVIDRNVVLEFARSVQN